MFISYSVEPHKIPNLCYRLVLLQNAECGVYVKVSYLAYLAISIEIVSHILTSHFLYGMMCLQLENVFKSVNNV